MHILLTVPEPATPRAYRLNPAFANSLRQALQGSGASGAFGLLCDDDRDGRTADQPMTAARLDAWARGQWEAILYYMVGSVGAALNSKAGARATSSMKKILELGNFVSVRGGRVNITKEGFAFLLQEANTQVWTLLIVYLGSAESVGVTDSVMLLANHDAASDGSSGNAVVPLHARIPGVWQGLQHGKADGYSKTHARRSQRLWNSPTVKQQ
jgi:transcription initiation factor TFIIH subunit 4